MRYSQLIVAWQLLIVGVSECLIFYDHANGDLETMTGCITWILPFLYLRRMSSLLRYIYD